MSVHSSMPWRLDSGAIKDHDGNLLATVPWTVGDEQDRTNAAMMTAAPELMQACILALTALEGMSTDQFARGDDREIRRRCEQALTRIMRITNNEDFSIHED